MTRWRMHLPIILAVGLMAVPLTSTAANQSDRFLTDQAVTIARSSEVLPARVKSFLADRNADTASVWVFFTDKAISGREGFQAEAAAVSISPKVLKRRAKVNRDEVLFVDLPVAPEYVDRVAALGGRLRRVSKWLNAASFNIAPDQLDAVAALPFVAEIRPVAEFKDKPTETAPIRSAPDQSLDATALSYGYALDQLAQIHVPEVHDKGYDGTGVTLAMFDTGFRLTHEAFAQAFADGRVLAMYDFVFNDSNVDYEPGIDWSSSISHGTLTWSTAAGYKPGYLYGPAYKANILLAKTEDVRSETQVEEDNWIAALEWADSLGADVISSSLGYSDWYTSADMDGATAPISIAAGTAASLGIVVCNSMGNEGPGTTSMSAPADAFDIIAVGAVDAGGTIASFSSRGPTADGRTKPEVVARGVSTSAASASSDAAYTTASGTSLSTPLMAGVACLLVQARPEFPPTLIRQALMETADRATNPDNNYGWGLANADSALSWGVGFAADPSQGYAPAAVQFNDVSALPHSGVEWDFGDGSTSSETNPLHTYTEAGAYTVSLTIHSLDYGDLTNSELNSVILLGDTLSYGPDSAYARQTAVLSVNLSNSQPLQRIVIPFTFPLNGVFTYDSIGRGDRTDYFDQVRLVSVDSYNRKYVAELIANTSSGAPPLPKGKGEVLRIYFSSDAYLFGGQTVAIDSLNATYPVTLQASYLTYQPEVYGGSLSLYPILRGDADNSGSHTIADITYLVSNVFQGGPPPITIQAGDANRDFFVNVADITYLVAYIFQGGPPPPTP